MGVERLHRVGPQPGGLTHRCTKEERLPGAFDAGVADFAPRQGEEQALQKEIDALEVLSQLERAGGAETVFSVHRSARDSLSGEPNTAAHMVKQIAQKTGARPVPA